MTIKTTTKAAHVSEVPAHARGGASVFLTVVHTLAGSFPAYGGPDRAAASAAAAPGEVELVRLDSVWTEEVHATITDFDGRRADIPSGVHAVLGSFIEGDEVVALVLESGLDPLAAASRCAAYTPGALAVRTGREEAWREDKDLSDFLSHG